MEMEREIRKFIADNLLYIDEEFQYDNDTSFISAGLVDSMGIMELVDYVQSSFHIKVQPHEVTPDNFDSVNRLVAFIRRKQCDGVQKGRENARSGRVSEQHAPAAG